MPDYSVFGGCFRSELSFPELPLLQEVPPTWTLRIVATPPLLGEGALVGEDQVESGMHVRLFRLQEGFRLVYNDTGTFDVPFEGSEIFWCPAPDADEDAARLDVIGYVFATLFHAGGAICLHGSAVALPLGGIGFVAPKMHGKSTLARALTRAGARLATDDAIPITVDTQAIMRPGVHQIRLRRDSAEHFARDLPEMQPGYGGKQVVTNIAEDRLLLEPVPLNALYVLAPVKPDGKRSAATRSLLSPVEAALGLVGQTKGACLFGRFESAAVLDRAHALVEAVPIYRLNVVRDFDRLDEVVQQILEWHGGVVSPFATSSTA